MRNSEIVDRFEKDFARCKTQCGDLHKAYSADKEFFLLDKQWSDSEVAARNPHGQAPRPTLTINRMRQFLMKVINDHKQARMGIKISPGGGDEDKDLAQVRQGIVRALEKNNGGRGAYNQAKEDQVTAGFGAWRLYADYVSPTSHDQEPKYLPIFDCSKLWWPISDCMQPDYSDMDCSIIQEDWSKDRFKRKFKIDPDTFLKTNKNPDGAWGAGVAPTVSEYYFKNEIPETLVKGLDGKGVFLSDLQEQATEMGVDVDMLCAKDEHGERIERDSSRCEIWWAKLAGRQVIGKPIKLPGQFIPVFIANGRKVVSNGKTELWSLGRPAKDSQRAHNYAASAEIERLALSPKAPYIVAEGSIPLTEKAKWETLNTGNWPYVKFLAYDPNTKQPLPPPHRTDPVQSDPGFMNLKAGTVDEMKATIGIYDASIGQRSNETSGVAIESRKREGDTATYDFNDNFSIAMRHCGRVLNEWIPEYIDTPRQILMVGEDDAEKVIRVNEPAQGEDGQPYHYPMDEGQFNIDIDSGPSASTKRQEAVQSMQEFYQVYPPAAAVTGHIFAKEMDWRYSDEFSKILKKMAGIQYPGVIDPDPSEGKQPIPPEAQQQMQQMQAQMQQMQEQLQQAGQAMQENQQLKADRSIEAQRLQIEKFKADTDRMKAQADIKVKQGTMLLKADDQQHDQTLENAKVIQDAHAQDHKHTQDKIVVAINAVKQSHQGEMDHKNFNQSAANADREHAFKVSQPGKGPTGANPGNTPSSPAKT